MDSLATHKISAVVSWILSAYATLRYFGGRQPFSGNSPHHVADTPFTINIVVTMVYWAVLMVMQVLFVSQIFVPAADSSFNTSRVDYTKKVGWHFTFFNLLVFGWTSLFVRQHYFWSQVLLLVNLVNILSLYSAHKTYTIRPLSNLVLIHFTTAALPLAWLFYAVFWNGAVLLHVHKFVGRVISNMLVWLLLVIPGSMTLVYNDWGMGLASSVLAFGLGLGQLFTKAFALQWIFGFIISGLLLLTSVLVASGKVVRRTEESAPLLNE